MFLKKFLTVDGKSSKELMAVSACTDHIKHCLFGDMFFERYVQRTTLLVVLYLHVRTYKVSVTSVSIP